MVIDRYQRALGRVLIIGWALFAGDRCVQGQMPRAPAGPPHIDTLMLDIDTTAVKKFATIESHLQVGQLMEAVDLLRGLVEQDSDKLVPGALGRYVTVRTQAQQLLAALPPAGLQLYRQQVDPPIRSRFQAAVEARDAQLLRQILDQAYCSSWGDDALWLLGQLAWEDGDLPRARYYWRQLIPLPPPEQPGEPVLFLAYPDTDLDQAQVAARLVLCSLMSQERSRALRELDIVKEMFPTAKGQLAGKSGTWVELLTDLMRESENWSAPLTTPGVPTFGGNDARDRAFAAAPEVGGVAWSIDLHQENTVPTIGAERTRFWPDLNTFPVVWGDLVFVNDQDTISAFDLQTGAPAWGGDVTNPDPLIYRLGEDDDDGGRFILDRFARVVGEPRYTMTISQGRLYARMGHLVPATMPASARGYTSRLVCLDVAQAEGKLLWELLATEVPSDSGPWAFEGSPLVVGNRLYCGLRRTDPQPQFNVICCDADTGQLIWNCRLTAVTPNASFEAQEICQNLLTYGAGTLFYATHQGCVAALDPQSGRIRWLATYDRIEERQNRDVIQRNSRGPLPPLYHDGTLIVAAADAAGVRAYDADTGLIRWQQDLGDNIQALLGVSEGRLFVSGSRLTALNFRTGDILWQRGSRDPETHGYGRGLLAGPLVYWPTRESLYLIEQATGELRQEKSLAEIHHQTGGNLTVAQGLLLVAQAERLTAFSEFSPPEPSQPAGPLSHRDRLTELWQQAQLACRRGDLTVAAELWRNVAESARPGDDWQSQPLREAAARKRWLMLVEYASRQNQTPEICTAAWNRALQAADDSRHDLLTRAMAATFLQDLAPVRSAALLRELDPHKRSPGWQLKAPGEDWSPVADWQRQSARKLLEGRPAEQRNELKKLVGNLTRPAPSAGHSTLKHISATPPGTIRWSIAWQQELSGGKIWSPEFATGMPQSDCLLLDGPPVVCLNLADGQERWRLRLPEPLRWTGYLAGQLILASARELYAVAPASGAVLWHGGLHVPPELGISLSSGRWAVRSSDSNAAVPGSLEAEPRLERAMIAAEKIVVLTAGGQLAAWDGRTGRFAWQLPVRPGRWIAGPWLVRDQLLVVSQSPARWWLIDPDQGTPSFFTSLSTAVRWESPAVLANGSFLLPGRAGQVQCYAPFGPAYWTNEGPLNWSRAAEPVHSLQPTSLVTDGSHLALLRDGRMLTGLDPVTGREAWSVPVTSLPVEEPAQQLACGSGIAALVTQSTVCGFSLETGQRLWTRVLGATDQDWRLMVHGNNLWAMATRVLPGEAASVWSLDLETGHPTQRLPLHHLAGTIHWQTQPAQLIAASPERCVVLKPAL